MSNTRTDDLAARSRPGYASYSPFVLRIYDFWVHGANNRLFWKCPTQQLIAHYRGHLTSNHLEIGVGTGLLLDRCSAVGERPRLVLCDMNSHCLARSARRLHRFDPVTVLRNVLEPIEGLGARFSSVGLNYVLHCLPGDIASKRCVFHHIAALLEPGGVLFGSTLLGKGVPLSWAARVQMQWLNRRKSFSNLHDDLAGLESGLASAFAEHQVKLAGCAALFTARTAG